MADRYLVVGLEKAELVDGELVGLALQTMTGTVGLGMHPEFVSGLAISLLHLLGTGARDGVLKPELLPTLLPVTEMVATESGIEFSMGMSTGLQFDSEMPWPVARQMAEKILRLCDYHENGAKPN